MRVSPNRPNSSVRSAKFDSARTVESRICIRRRSHRPPRNSARPRKPRPIQAEAIRVGGRVYHAPGLALGFGLCSRIFAGDISHSRFDSMRAIDYFDKGAETNPDRIGILDGARSYSYSEVRALTDQIACAMRADGLRDEERAAIYSPNDARVLICMFGLMRAGAAWVPMNSRNATDASVEYMNYVATSWLFYHSNFREQVQDFKNRVPSLQHLVCIDAADRENPSLESFAKRGAGLTLEDWGDAYGNNERLVGLVPTGGTTGPAKGVRVTSLAWGTMLEMASYYWRGDTTEPICLNVAPLSHAAGVVAFAAASLGAINVVLPAFDASEVARAIERHRITHLFLPPTALYKLLALPDIAKFDYSSLRVFLLAGSPSCSGTINPNLRII